MRRAVAIAGLLLLAGCAGGPAPRIYVLGDPPPTDAGVWSQAGKPVVQVLPVAVPDYLDTREMLVRNGRNEVAPNPNGRWAERLSVGLTRALATALGTRLPQAVVTDNVPVVPPARRVVVTVAAFEISPAGRCQLDARWAITAPGGKDVRSARGSFVEEAGSGDGAAVAAAMTRAVDRMADAIARDWPGT
jgi:uncharacterized protein